MTRFKKTIQNYNEGRVIYGDTIVDDIVYLAVTEIPYVKLVSPLYGKSKLNTKSIKVHKEKDGIYVDVSAKIHFTQSVSDMAFKIQEAIRHNVEAMTEFRVVGVNVSIRGVMFDDIPLDPVDTLDVVELEKSKAEDEKKENKWEV